MSESDGNDKGTAVPAASGRGTVESTEPVDQHTPPGRWRKDSTYSDYDASDSGIDLPRYRRMMRKGWCVWRVDDSSGSLERTHGKTLQADSDAQSRLRRLLSLYGSAHSLHSEGRA